MKATYGLADHLQNSLGSDFKRYMRNTLLKCPSFKDQHDIPHGIFDRLDFVGRIVQKGVDGSAPILVPEGRPGTHCMSLENQVRFAAVRFVDSRIEYA